MNCSEARAMIEALPLTEYDPAQRAAIERHTRGCAACQRALASARRLDSQLHELTGPTPSTDLETAIMQRIAQIDATRAMVPHKATTAIVSQNRIDRRVRMATGGGAALALTTQMYPLLSGEATVSLAGSLLKGGMQGLIALPPVQPSTLFLAAGVLVYVAGLFGSVNSVKERVR